MPERRSLSSPHEAPFKDKTIRQRAKVDASYDPIVIDETHLKLGTIYGKRLASSLMISDLTLFGKYKLSFKSERINDSLVYSTRTNYRFMYAIYLGFQKERLYIS